MNGNPPTPNHDARPPSLPSPDEIPLSNGGHAQQETPRTDAEIALNGINVDGVNRVNAGFARRLERELAEARRERDSARETAALFSQQSNELRAERDKYKADFEHCSNAHDTLVQDLGASEAALAAEQAVCAELRKDRQRLDWLTLRLEDAFVGEADPTNHMTEMMGWPEAWRLAIDAARRDAQDKGER